MEMENQVQIFDNPEFGEVRVIMKDGEPHFVAADVCRALEISNVSDAEPCFYTRHGYRFNRYPWGARNARRQRAGTVPPDFRQPQARSEKISAVGLS